MTNRFRKASLALAMAAMAGGLGGCAQTSKLLSFFGFDRSERPKLAIRPAITPSEAEPVTAEDRLYAEAKQAIEARDYATALDLLQVAKQRAPNDGRVLNAMGVVYDKLGRFDLSRRYYELALAAHPNSPAVLANLKYSSRLQAFSTQLQEQPVGVAAAPAPAIRLAAAPAAAIRIVEPAYLGSAVRIVDASGHGLAPDVRRHLVANGWSVDIDSRQRASSDSSVIVFKAEHRRVAEALANTLPFRTTLQPCGAGCSGVRLVLGANARLQGRG